MSRDVITAEESETLSEVLGRMREQDIHEIPVIDDRRRLLGMVGYTNLLRRRNLPLTTKVSQLIVRTPQVEPGDHLSKVAELLMSSGYRAMPVAEDGFLVGIVSRTDIIKFLKDTADLRGITVSSVMTPKPHTIHHADTIAKAKQVLGSLDTRAIPVVDDQGKLVGVVGFKDFSGYLLKPKDRPEQGAVVAEKGPSQLEVKSFMRTPAITLSPDASVADAARLMAEHDISSVIVVEEGEPVGIVTQVDLMELVASLQTRDQLYVQISGLGEEEAWAYDSMYDLIQKGIRRISDIVRPTILNIHVAMHDESPDRSKYSIRARLTCDHGMYYSWEWDWDIFKALDKVMDQFERRIKKEKELRLQGRKNSRRPA
jgi:ribosomal subunit interface protein